MRQIAEDIEQLHGTPLGVIGAELKKTLGPLLGGDDGVVVSGHVNDVIAHVSDLLSVLPKSFGQRFTFDAALIHALMDEWNPALKLRRLALPAYDPRWGYRRLAMPSSNRESTLVFDLFFIPGRDVLDEVDLLDYPWIVHELAHCLMHVHSREFPDAFRPNLQKHFRDLRLLAVADRGRAREKADAAMRQVEEFWTPANDQRDWAHEIAFDVCALWTCGPAFLGAFHNTLRDLNPGPFIKKQDHPPYIVRVEALIDAAKKLHFDRYSADLSEVLRNHLKAVEQVGKKNDLLLFAPNNLVGDCVSAAISVAGNFGLRRWREIDPSRFLAEPSFGFDLFAAAFKKSQAGPSAYAEWQRAIVDKLTASVTL
jgi:hypothetical protein